MLHSTDCTRLGMTGQRFHVDLHGTTQVQFSNAPLLIIDQRHSMQKLKLSEATRIHYHNFEH